jgi:hypothetical protein
MQMTFKGHAVKQGELPIGLTEAKQYFSDIKAFIRKIEDVKDIKDLSMPQAYLMTHHPMGALNYYITFVTAVQATETPDGLLLKSLDFDENKVKSDHPPLKGFIDGRLQARELEPDRTAIDFNFDLTIDFKLPTALMLVPRGLIQSTADGLMSLKLTKLVNDMYQKVVDDFRLAS